MRILYSNKLSKFPQVVNFVTTRKGGVSKLPYNELNLGLHVGDHKAAVLQNRKKLSDKVGISQNNFIYLNQVQGNNVLVAKKEHKGSGSFDYERCIKQTDAAITTTPEICLVTLVADCVNILLFDPKKKMIGVVHAGWQGTLNLAAKTTIEKAKREFGCDPKDIIASLGPSIDPCCYEIGTEVVSQFEQKLPADAEHVIKHTNGKAQLDNKLANKRQLLSAGLKDENIEVSKICTGCQTDRFYSYRIEEDTGRFGAGIMLKK
jgi:polyphenol oxidase